MIRRAQKLFKGISVIRENSNSGAYCQPRKFDVGGELLPHTRGYTLGCIRSGFRQYQCKLIAAV
jgi:hypothetical protein